MSIRLRGRTAAVSPTILRQRPAIRRGDDRNIWLARLALILAVGVVWQVVSASGLIDPLFIGTPTRIMEFFWSGFVTEGTLWPDTVYTLLETVAAFVIGSIAGIVVGAVFARSPVLERVCAPFFVGLNSLPRIALAPLFVLWFGLGFTSKVALGVTLTFFVVLEGTLAGARSVDNDLVRLARLLDASPRQVFLTVTLPSAVPTLFSSLRLGLVIALLGVVSGEIIAAQRGLGQQISYLAGTFNTDGVFAVLFALALMGTSLGSLMSVVERRLANWR